MHMEILDQKRLRILKKIPAAVSGIPYSLRITGIPDIACMKCIAIGNRGTRKDFFDLYEIVRSCDTGPDQLASWLADKYGNDKNLAYVAMGMNYFEDAEGEILPETFVPYERDDIRAFFSSFHQDLLCSLERLSDYLEL